MFLSYYQVLPLGNVCKNHRCVSCCYDTEMLLLDDDLERISGLGYDLDFFQLNDFRGFQGSEEQQRGQVRVP